MNCPTCGGNGDLDYQTTEYTNEQTAQQLNSNDPQTRTICPTCEGSGFLETND